MQSTPQCHSAPAWSSFATGLNPGRHGIFSFMNRVPHSYDCRRIDARDRHGKTFWDLAGGHGRRCAVLNVPVTYPVSPLNGVQIGDWLCPSLSAPGATHPAELAQELMQRLGTYRFHADVKRHVIAGHHRAALENLREGISQKAEVGRLVWEREPWDLYVLAFVETDAAQHYYLHAGDEHHPLRQQAVAAGLDGVFLDIYKQLDGVLADLLARLDDNTTLLVMSDHGATANGRGRCFMRGFLRNAGVLTMQPPRGVGERLKRSLVGGRKWAFELANAHLPKSIKVKLNRLIPQARERVFADSFTVDVDWARTKAYSYYWETDPFVNLQGRDPDGIVASGTEYDEVCRHVADQLLTSRELKSGRPAVEGVRLKDGLFHGPFADLGPDLMVDWTENQIIEGLVSEVDGRELVARADLRDDTIGAHHPDALLLAWGAGVKPGEVPAGASIMDLAPSILALLGCPVPADLDGRVLDGVLDVDVETSGSSGSEAGEPETVYTAEEEAEVEDRLRNLGYL
jgi:predicted AlkP superfamily phosphohydrolase/phosphomutase